MTQEPPINWLKDDPLETWSDDALDRSEFVSNISSLIRSLHEDSGSSVVGLIGPWGSGKSSILSGVSSQMASHDENWIVTHFNPWYYQNHISLQTGFFNELDAALPTGPEWGAVRNKIAKIGKALAPVGIAGVKLFGLDVSAVISGAANAFEHEFSVTEQTNQAENALIELNRPILIIIDDIDRLDPPELLLLFKLIRLVGRLPHVHYLLAYDETTVLDVLSRTGFVDTDKRRAIEYLAKIVQIRIDIPPVRDIQIERWLNAYLEVLSERHDLHISDESMERFSQAYHACLHYGFGTTATHNKCSQTTHWSSTSCTSHR